MSVTLKTQLLRSKSQRRKIQELQDKIIAEKMSHQLSIDMHLEKEQILAEKRRLELLQKERQKEEKRLKLLEDKKMRESEILQNRYYKDREIKEQADHILMKQQEKIDKKKEKLEKCEFSHPLVSYLN